MTNASQPEPTELPWEAAFTSNLKRARERLKWSQTELAKRAAERGLPFHQQTVQRVETQTRPIRLNEALVLAQIVGEDLGTMISAPTAGSAKVLLHHRQESAKRLRADVVQWLRETRDRADRDLLEFQEAVQLYDDVVPGGVSQSMLGKNAWHERSLKKIADGCRNLLEKIDGPALPKVSPLGYGPAFELERESDRG